MYTPKVKHEHNLEPRYLKTSVTIKSVRYVRYIHTQVCTLKGCTYSQANDLIPELPEGVKPWTSNGVTA